MSNRTLQEQLDYRAQMRETVQVLLYGHAIRTAEVIGPWDSPMLGYRAEGLLDEIATERLSYKLARDFGFIGRLVEGQ